MTFFYSIDKDKLKRLSGSTEYDLFSKTIIDSNDQNYKIYIVQYEDECRIENICFKIYKNYNYIEELLVFNDILDSYNISVGDEIKYLENSSEYSKMYKNDIDLNKDVLNKLLKANSNKSTIKPNIPTIKPETLKQIDIDYKNNEIKIINKYQ